MAVTVAAFETLLVREAARTEVCPVVDHAKV